MLDLYLHALKAPLYGGIPRKRMGATGGAMGKGKGKDTSLLQSRVNHFQITGNYREREGT